MLFYVLLYAAVLVLGKRAPVASFDPYAYKLATTRCSAVDHATGASRLFNLEYLRLNPAANRTIIFVHGWPNIWTIWAPQIVEFSKDYHVIVPNLRGFGKSGFIGSVETTGTFFDIANDLNCLMKVENVKQAACVGIDWGSQICYEMAIFYSEKILGASGTLPYQPNAGPFVPVWSRAELVPQLGYQVYFNNLTDAAVSELNRDIRRSIRSTLKSSKDPAPPNYLLNETNYLGCWKNEPIPLSTDLMSLHQENYMVEQFAIQGFNKNLFFYQNANRVLDYNYTGTHGGATINRPVLFLPPAFDGVVKDFNQWMETLDAYQYLPKYQTVTLNSGHWVTLEVPDAYNAHLTSWLQTSVFPTVRRTRPY